MGKTGEEETNEGKNMTKRGECMSSEEMDNLERERERQVRVCQLSFDEIERIG